MSLLQRALVLVSVLCASISAAIAQSDVACTPTTPIAQQSRTKLKHRSIPAGPAPQATTIGNILKWKAPARISSPAVRASNSPIDPQENQIFSVSGDLQRVIMEDNDCDFHLEMSAPGAGPMADRIIVEVPQDAPYKPVRQAILQKLAQSGISFPAPVMVKTIPIQVTGFGFYDAFHFATADPQRGHDHGSAFVGTLWELHPIWNVSF